MAGGGQRAPAHNTLGRPSRAPAFSKLAGAVSSIRCSTLRYSTSYISTWLLSAPPDAIADNVGWLDFTHALIAMWLIAIGRSNFDHSAGGFGRLQVA